MSDPTRQDRLQVAHPHEPQTTVSQILEGLSRANTESAGPGGYPRTLHIQAAETLRSMIYRGDLPGGVRLNEVELAATLGISRTPLREALRLLASEGLIDLVPHRGAFVSSITSSEAPDLIEVLAVLDGLCARRAALSRSRSQLEALRNLHARLEAAAREDMSARSAGGEGGDGLASKVAELDRHFHSLIRECGTNSIAAAAAGRADLQARRSSVYPRPPHRALRNAIDEHAAILAAIAERRPLDAETAMREHIARCADAAL